MGAEVMTDRTKTRLAGEVYRTFCSAFTAKNWEYKKTDRKRQLDFPVMISGVSTNFTVTVDASRQLVRLVASLPGQVSTEQLPQAVTAICQANCRMADGSFDLNPADNRVSFRVTAFFHNSSIGEAFIGNMIGIAIAGIKKYSGEILPQNNEQER